MVLDPQRETRRMRTSQDGPAIIGRLTTETRRAFTTTEFWAFVAVLAGILVASYVIDGGDGGAGADGGDGDPFGAFDAWRLVTFLTIGYMVSRGLAKAGSREPYWATERDLPNGDGHKD